MDSLENRQKSCNEEIQAILKKYGFKFSISMDNEIKLALEIIKTHPVKINMILEEANGN